MESESFVYMILQVWREVGADLGGGCRGCKAPPPPKMTCGFLIQLEFCKKNYVVFGVEVEQETSAPPPKRNPGSAPEKCDVSLPWWQDFWT